MRGAMATLPSRILATLAVAAAGIASLASGAAAAPVTAAAAAAASPAAAGPIKIGPLPNRTGHVGDPVIFKVKATDSLPGAKLSYGVSGLPGGVDYGRGRNVFYGWLTWPGTYHVSVGVSDSQDNMSLASFTWTVRPGVGAGPSGRIRLGAVGKCLAAGRGGQVWTCNGGRNQHWTMGYDQTIRARGKCLTERGAHKGARVVLAACKGSLTGQEWQLESGPYVIGKAAPGPVLRNLASGLCLNIPGSVHNGSRLVVWQCKPWRKQVWNAPAGPILSQVPGMCLADPGNRTANGTRLVFWKCNGWREEAFTFRPDGAIRIHGKCLAVRPGNRQQGQHVVLSRCDGGWDERWVYNGTSLVFLEAGLIIRSARGTIGDGTPVGVYLPGAQYSDRWRVL